MTRVYYEDDTLLVLTKLEEQMQKHGLTFLLSHTVEREKVGYVDVKVVKKDIFNV